MVMHLNEDRVGELLRWDRLIAAMETALAGFSLGRVIQPVRNMLTIEEGKRYLGIMPAVAEDAMGVKLVSFYPGNAGTRVPTHLAMVLLFRPDTGEPLAVMDGKLITEMRTAAVSAAATRRLAAPNSRVLALLGSGVQARAHLQALMLVHRFEEVRVWSRTAEHAERFAEQHKAKAMPVEAAMRGADVIVTATNALQPILQGAWLKTGAHVNAVGSPRPDWRELDDRRYRGHEQRPDRRERVLEQRIVRGGGGCRLGHGGGQRERSHGPAVARTGELRPDVGFQRERHVGRRISGAGVALDGGAMT